MSAAATETSGIRRPPIPSERTNGTGTSTSRPRPTVTAPPAERDRAPRRRNGPHDRIVDGALAVELLAEAHDHEQRVVDREPQPDQLDEVPHVGDHRDLVGDQEDHAERDRDRARGDDERDDDREGKPEERKEHEQRQRDRDRLAAMEIRREHRVEVRLHGGLAGDERRGRAAQSSSQRRCVVLRVLEVERGADLGEHDPVRVLHGPRVPRRHVACRAVEARLQAGGAPRSEDDRERPVGPNAEVRLQELPGVVGFSSRDRKRAGQERRQTSRRGHSSDERRHPEREHDDAEANDGSGEAQQPHGYLPIRLSLHGSTVAA